MTEDAMGQINWNKECDQISPLDSRYYTNRNTVTEMFAEDVFKMYYQEVKRTGNLTKAIDAIEERWNPESTLDRHIALMNLTLSLRQDLYCAADSIHLVEVEKTGGWWQGMTADEIMYQAMDNINATRDEDLIGAIRTRAIIVSSEMKNRVIDVGLGDKLPAWVKTKALDNLERRIHNREANARLGPVGNCGPYLCKIVGKILAEEPLQEEILVGESLI